MTRPTVIVLVVTAMLGGGLTWSPPVGVEAAAAKDTLTVGLNVDVVSLDPSVSFTYGDYNTYLNIFDPLFRRDRNMVPQPLLATSLRMVDDLTWEVKLRRGVRFQNGELFDATAVKFTVDRILDKSLASQQATWFQAIAGVDIVDPYTVRFRTKAPYAPISSVLTQVYPVPPHYVAQAGNDAFAHHPIGTGPWKFVEWVAGQHITLERNDQYWGPPVTFRRLVVRPIPDPSTAVASLLAGEVDIVPEISVAQVDQVQASQVARVAAVPGARVCALQFNVMHTGAQPAITDRRVRQAIASAIDVKTLMLLEHGFADPVATMLAPSVFGYDPSIPLWPYDPAKAKALLREAGYGSGLNLTLNTQPSTKEETQAIAGMLQQVGIQPFVRLLDPTAFNTQWKADTLGGDTYTVCLLAQSFDADSMLALRFYKDQPMTYYYDPRTMQWIDEARSTLDPKKRQALYAAFMRYLFQGPRAVMPAIPLYTERVVYGVSRAVEWTPRTDDYLFLYDAKPAK